MQTTAAFIDETDVVRIVGDCERSCVRQAVSLLRRGDVSDLSDVAPVVMRRSTRIFLGVVMGAIGLFAFASATGVRGGRDGRSLDRGWAPAWFGGDLPRRRTKGLSRKTDHD